MNVGDIVKITDKRNPNMWCSGIVINPEDDYVWATVKTMHDDKWIVEGYDYDIEVVGTVEPEAIGSTHTSKNKQYVKWSTDLDRRWMLTDDPHMYTFTWEEIAG